MLVAAAAAGTTVAIIVAAVGVLVSFATLALTEWRYRTERQIASPTVALVWLRNSSRVRANGQELHAGYNLVLENRGPAEARCVDLEIYRFDEMNERVLLKLVDVYGDEFPLSTLDPGAKYPLRFVDHTDAWRNERRFEAQLHWSDGRRGRQSKRVPLRRGATSS